MFAPTAVAAALSVVQGFGGPGVVGPQGDRTATREQLVAVFDEAERFAPVASRWAGYEIPPEVVYAIGTQESCWRNLSRHCHGGGAENRRSAGFFALTAPCVWQSERVLGNCLGIPWREPSDRYWLGEWKNHILTREEICDWTVGHPREQVRILLHRLAIHVRETRGDLWRALARYGPEGSDRDYPADVRRCWLRTFRQTWPRNGRLQ